MIETDRAFGTFEMFCDEIGCDHSILLETDGDFYQAIKEAKEYGWTMKKDGKDWVHTCPTCKE